MATKRSKISPKELIAELEKHGVYVITEIAVSYTHLRAHET